MGCKKVFIKAAKITGKTLGSVLMKYIAETVTGLATYQISGTLKRETAIALAKAKADAMKIEATKSMLGLAVDACHLVVNKLELGTPEDIGIDDSNTPLEV